LEENDEEGVDAIDHCRDDRSGSRQLRYAQSRWANFISWRVFTSCVSRPFDGWVNSFSQSIFSPLAAHLSVPRRFTDRAPYQGLCRAPTCDSSSDPGDALLWTAGSNIRRSSTKRHIRHGRRLPSIEHRPMRQYRSDDRCPGWNGSGICRAIGGGVGRCREQAERSGRRTETNPASAADRTTRNCAFGRYLDRKRFGADRLGERVYEHLPRCSCRRTRTFSDVERCISGIGHLRCLTTMNYIEESAASPSA
jgi:hypothetical protein